MARTIGTPVSTPPDAWCYRVTDHGVTGYRVTGYRVSARTKQPVGTGLDNKLRL